MCLLYTSYLCSKNDTDYTPAVVELICHLGDNVAMVAIRLLIKCAQLMGIPAKDSQTGLVVEDHVIQLTIPTFFVYRRSNGRRRGK